MKKNLWTVVLAVIGIAGLLTGAFAADMPVKAPASVAAPAFNWSGFYVGGIATYGGGDSEHCIGPCSGTTFRTVNIDGWLGGITAGWNYQVSNWVLGLEADGSWGRINGADKSTPGFGCGPEFCRTDIRSLITTRGRLGYAFDRLLPYATVGAGFSNFDASNSASGDSTTKTSLVWGGGLEYAFAPQWTAKVEYLRVEKLGDFNYDKLLACGVPGCHVHDVNFDTIRIGLNYKFGH